MKTCLSAGGVTATGAAGAVREFAVEKPLQTVRQVVLEDVRTAELLATCTEPDRDRAQDVDDDIPTGVSGQMENQSQ